MLKKTGGFTLVELILVIAIFGITTVVAVPRLARYKSLAEKAVCSANKNTIKRMYIVFLVENDHEESAFSQFLIENFNEVCPNNGKIIFKQGKVICNLHGDSNEDGDELPGDEVQWF